jgi:hypothetical protein
LGVGTIARQVAGAGIPATELVAEEERSIAVYMYG